MTITLVMKDDNVIQHTPLFYTISNDMVYISCKEDSANVDYTYHMKDIVSVTITN